MSKVRYSATFSLPDGSEYVLTRGSRQDYGYTVAWLLLAGDDDRLEHGAVLVKGFSRTRQLAESAARPGLQNGQGRIALFAPVTKGGAS
jgi:hypothetical protein